MSRQGERRIRGGRVSFERKLGVRRKLMDAAAALFEEGAAEGVTVEEITRRAGVAKGTFFNYFPGKKDLLRALQEDALTPVGDLLVEGRFRRLSPSGKLAELAHRAAESVEGKPWLARLIAHRLLEDGPTAERVSGEGARSSLTRIVAGIVREGQLSGELGSDSQAAEAAELFVGAFVSALAAYARDGTAPGPGARARRAVEILVKGLTDQG
jgi:AcrR family transcriptional regulator